MFSGVACCVLQTIYNTRTYSFLLCRRLIRFIGFPEMEISSANFTFSLLHHLFQLEKVATNDISAKIGEKDLDS